MPVEHLRPTCSFIAVEGLTRSFEPVAARLEGIDFRAGCENRTHDIFITSEVLCRLS